MGFERFGLGLLSALLVGSAHADPAQERAALRAQIERITAAQAAEEHACKARFAVTSCVDDARQRRREAIAPLRARQLELDDVERRERALARREAIESKRMQATQRASAPALETVAPRASQPSHAASAASARPPRAPIAAARHQAAASEAAQRAQATAERQARIREDAERTRARQAEKEMKKRPAAPLPVPEAASLPRR